MSILAPCIGLALLIVAVVDICFRLDNRRTYRTGWRQGWTTRGRKAREWLRNPEKP